MNRGWKMLEWFGFDHVFAPGANPLLQTGFFNNEDLILHDVTGFARTRRGGQSVAADQVDFPRQVIR
jgi:hypothetical protein